jgi:hypothetical protein
MASDQENDEPTPAINQYAQAMIGFEWLSSNIYKL